MAMLKNKHVTFSLILVCLSVVSPMAKAQLPGLPVIPPPLRINVIVITGVVNCTLNATVNGASAPPFPNATVQLRCPPLNTVVATTTTNVNGMFTIILPSRISPATLSNCSIFVATPLVSCNATLPRVNLASPLTVLGSFIFGLINFIIVVPTALISSVPLP